MPREIFSHEVGLIRLKLDRARSSLADLASIRMSLRDALTTDTAQEPGWWVVRLPAVGRQCDFDERLVRLAG